MSDADTPFDLQSLPELRAHIDDIDDRIHDLLMRRAQIVAVVADRKRDGDGRVGLALRPGREAAILRRIVTRHTGPLPVTSIVQIWRELLSGTTRMQGSFTIALFHPVGRPEYRDLARLHFGAHARIRVIQSAQIAVCAVSGQENTIALLPLPDAEADDPWWHYLLGTDCPRIVARLPFAGALQGRGAQLQGFVVAAMETEETGHDKSVLVIETDAGISRDRLHKTLAEAELTAGLLFLSRTEDVDACRYLIEVDGYVTGADRRLATLVKKDDGFVRDVMCLGAYAVPLSDNELGLRADT